MERRGYGVRQHARPKSHGLRELFASLFFVSMPTVVLPPLLRLSTALLESAVKCEPLMSVMGKGERLFRVGGTHCRVAASGQPNSTDRFRAMSLKSGRTQPDPHRSDNFLQTGQSAKFRFANWSANKRPLATSPNRPEAALYQAESQ